MIFFCYLSQKQGNVDTLKTMQLLGFNYKEAIGIPLTKLCTQAIENLSNKKNITKKIKIVNYRMFFRKHKKHIGLLCFS